VNHLSIDIETYSSVDLKKCGMFKYVESPDFEILLFAYSLNGEPVQVVDLANGEKLPPNIANAIADPDYIKHAYNAMFEWRCLSKFFGELPIAQWHCTMMHGLYCGYTAGLEATGKAVGLPQDRQKLNTGKALIRYFCVPCKPTKTNGQRVRNLPHHDPERWGLFKDYCAQDVVTEMAIESKLSAFPVPEAVQKEWQTDVLINARGVAVDMELVQAALAISANARERHMSEAQELTGLDNPNSRSQLFDFLEAELGIELTDIRKATVDELLKGTLSSDTVRRVLELRQELSKTSTKKYNAIEAAVCADGRVRGLLQFYGANRTGRWAGRLVQVQNLPRTYTEPLKLARQLVKEQNEDALTLIYGSIPDTLSQLIRTAFTAAPGNILVDADFSSIEARVVAWIAAEQWALEVFRTHGKIYEATAAQLYGIPIEKIKKGNPEYQYRQYGKAATLALGYQGGIKALIKVGHLPEDTDEEVLQDIVNRWRNANRRIRDFWYAMDSAAVKVVTEGGSVAVGCVILTHEYDHNSGIDCMSIRLPSGRKLYYISPEIGINQWGNKSVTYLGVEQGKKTWGRIETYGGKLTENITQAIARDCLSIGIERLAAVGYPVVFHVHDEVVIDLPKDNADLDTVAQILSAPIPWAQDLPLGADGWVGDFYRKD
jgi:DNA polymerase